MTPERAREVLEGAGAGVARLVESLRSVGLLTAHSTICTLCGVSCSAGETVPHRAGCLLAEDGAMLLAATISEAARVGAKAIAERPLLVAQCTSMEREINACFDALAPRSRSNGLLDAVESRVQAHALELENRREADEEARLLRTACGLANEVGGSIPRATVVALLARAAAGDLTAEDRKLLEARWATSVTFERRDNANHDGGLVYTIRCRDCRLRRDFEVSAVEIASARVPIGPELRRRFVKELAGFGCPHPTGPAPELAP